MAVVSPEERSAAAGITSVARTIGAAISPLFVGFMFARPALINLPFFIAGAVQRTPRSRARTIHKSRGTRHTAHARDERVAGLHLVVAIVSRTSIDRRDIDRRDDCRSFKTVLDFRPLAGFIDAARQ